MGHRQAWLVWMVASVACAAGCYDTKIIEAPADDERDHGGEAGLTGNTKNDAGSAGEPPLGSGGGSEPDAGAAGERGVTPEGGTSNGGRTGAEAGSGSGGRAAGGRAGGGAASGGSNRGGVDSGGVSSGGKGGTATAGNGTGGTIASTGGSAPLPGVTWLSLAEDIAPSSLEPNGELGINGQLYAYADDCATLDWDPVTRCASGSLCAAGPNFQNWGIAVGFYFDTTGPDGTPPNTKYTWDPTEIDVTGVAWRISGTAPALQLWILNMDSAYGGECAEESCEIIGPPDGTSTPMLQGTLSFDNLHKDNWNSGIDYEFDPAAIHALQFKIPAIVTGATSFSFCVDAVGVVRD